MNIHSSISSLMHIIQNEINEEKFISKSEEIIDSLRKCWKLQKDDFTEIDIKLLKKIASQVEAIKEFAEILETLPHLGFTEDVDETIQELGLILEKVRGLPISARVQKEIRELSERRSRLPSRKDVEKNAKFFRALNKLEANTYICKKCGAKMVVKIGNGYFFWGCPNFPYCWGKRWFTKDERNILAEGLT